MTGQSIGTCDYCDAVAVMSVNGHKSCKDKTHIDRAVEEASKAMRAVREAFDRRWKK